MKTLTFAIVGAAALTLAACGSKNEDQVDNAVMNQPNPDQLNELANDAANDAANAPAAAPAKNAVDENASATADNASNPSDDQEKNVSGM